MAAAVEKAWRREALRGGEGAKEAAAKTLAGGCFLEGEWGGPEDE